MPKDKGWDYLNSDDVNDTFNSGDDESWGYKNDDGSGSYHGADGSWGYQNEDGSGSYYGADGSWGYKNADGSGSYYGADGSWGYKNADGSSSYYGNDGSWGYKNTDASGSFYGSDNSSTYYDSDDDDDDDDYSYSGSSGDSDLASSLAELAVGLGALAFVKHTAKAREEARQEEERHRELERIAEEKRQARQAKREHDRRIRNKRLKAFFFNKKNLQLEFSTSDLIGEDYQEVLTDLAEAGFNNCKAVSIKDIYVGSGKYVGEVEQVVINGQSWLSEGTMVPYDAEIVVTYHLKKEIEYPFNSREVSKMTFEQVADRLLYLGFTEVYTLPLRDLKTGWIKKENSVQQVVIAGVESIRRGMALEYDKKITVQYHSFAK